jgi:hypothetical protein
LDDHEKVSFNKTQSHADGRFHVACVLSAALAFSCSRWHLGPKSVEMQSHSANAEHAQ